MPKIKMLVGLSGNEYSLSPGDVRDFPDGEAVRLVAAGYAELVEPEAPVKQAPKASKKAE